MLALALFAAPPLLTVMLFLWHYWRANKILSRKSKNFQPSQQFNPTFCNLVLNQQVTPSGLIATILNLCAEGYLRLYHQPLQSDPYILELIKDPAHLEPEQQPIVSIFFPKPQLNQQVSLFAQSTQQAHERKAQLQQIAQRSGTRLANQGYFISSPSAAKSSAISGLIYLSILIGFIVVWIIWPQLYDSTLQFFSKFISASISSSTLAFILGLGIAVAINTALALYASHYTKAGIQMHQQILDFKQRIEPKVITDINQSQLPQNISSVVIPESNLELLQFTEPLLGYCIALGLDKTWPIALQQIFVYRPLDLCISDKLMEGV